MPKNPERREEPLQDLGKTLEGITREWDEWKRRWLKQALAGIMSYLPDGKKSGTVAPDGRELQIAMIQRIDADTSEPDIAGNPWVKAIKKEMIWRINSGSNPSTLLENYAQMRGMLDGAVGTVVASQSQWAKDFRDSKAKNWEDLSKLTLVELGDNFRRSIAEAQALRNSQNQRNANNAHEQWNNFTGVTSENAFAETNRGLEVGFRTLA